MRIGILGTGLMAEALGGHWARAGHQLMVGGRTPAKAEALAGRLGATAGSLADAAAFGDVTLLAVQAAGVEETLAGAGDLAGRPLIDCTNAVVPGRFVLSEPAVAARIAAATGARVVKAFNLCADAVWRDAPREFEGRPLGVPLCGDDPAAVELVAGLVRDTGCEPVPAGGLDRAALLEATAVFAIGIWAAGGDVRALVPPLEHAFGTVAPG